MSDAAYIADGQRWAGALVDRERRATGGKVGGILADLARRLDIDHGDLWSLRYRPPRVLSVSVYMRLKAAYERECERQEARLAHELMLTKAVGWDATTSRAVAQAEAFLDAKEAAE